MVSIALLLWSDSDGRIWVSEWMSGRVSVYDPKLAASGKAWRSWKLPGAKPRAYSVWVDENDKVWLTDFGVNAIVRFDPETETFESFPSTRSNAAVRQMLGRTSEAWGAESGADRAGGRGATRKAWASAGSDGVAEVMLLPKKVMRRGSFRGSDLARCSRFGAATRCHRRGIPVAWHG